MLTRIGSTRRLAPALVLVVLALVHVSWLGAEGLRVRPKQKAKARRNQTTGSVTNQTTGSEPLESRRESARGEHWPTSAPSPHSAFDGAQANHSGAPAGAALAGGAQVQVSHSTSTTAFLHKSYDVEEDERDAPPTALAERHISTGQDFADRPLSLTQRFETLPGAIPGAQVLNFKVPSVAELLKDPLELFVLLFFVTSCMYCTKILLIDVLAANRLEDVVSQRDAVANQYNIAEAKMRGQLKNLEDSAAMVAEQTFQGHALSFQRFLDDVARSPDYLLGNKADQAALLDTFRKFVQLWLHAFEQCSLQPQTLPRRVMKEAELSTCDSAAQVAKLTSRRMAQHPIRFVSKTWDSVVGSFGPIGPAANKAGRSNLSWISLTCGLGVHFETNTRTFPVTFSFGCFSVTLLAWFHVRVLFAVGKAAALIGLLIALQRLPLAAAAVGVEVLLLTVLYNVERIDTGTRMEAQIVRLARQHELAEKKEKDIKAQCVMVASVTNLWRYRTMPHLSLFKQLSEQLPDTPDTEKVAFMKGTQERLDRIDSGLGDLWMWQGQQALEDSHLQMGAQQLKDAAHFIRKSRKHKNATKLVLDRLDYAFGFLAVRVVSCQTRTLKGQAIQHPHIVVRIGKEDSKSFRARIGGDAAQAPFVTVDQEDGKFELEVWSGSPKTDDGPMGSVHEDFRVCSAGVWHRRREKLYSFGAFQARCLGEIEYDVYFANSIRLLDKCKSSSATSLKQLNSFLSD